MNWGPQPTGLATAPGARHPLAGAWLWVFPLGWLIPGWVWLSFSMTALSLHHRHEAAPSIDATVVWLSIAFIATTLLAVPLGMSGGRRWTGWFYQRRNLAAACLLLCLPQTIAYTIGYLAGRRGKRLPRLRLPRRRTQPAALETRDLVRAADPVQAVTAQVQARTGRLPGAVLGWSRDGEDRLVTAPPRGGVLVLGPPGSID